MNGKKYKMNPREILEFCLKKGFLLDREVLELLSGSDLESVKLIVEKIKDYTEERVITKKIFNENKDKVSQFFSDLPIEEQKKLEKLKIKLGLSIEISKEIETRKILKEIETKEETAESFGNYKVKVDFLSSVLKKKPEVEDFVKFFRNRFLEMKRYLQEHSNLNNLVSIDKISGNRQGQVSLIGIVSDKRPTKSKNILLELEDLSGKIKILISQSKKELYKKAEDICLDSVIGVKISGNREIAFANDIIFPDSVLLERKKSIFDEYTLFIGDLHIGSKFFLEDNFLKFIDYLNGRLSNANEAGKIRYLFIIGDLVAGIGVYPKQEKDLALNNLEEQFLKATELLSKIRKDIAIIISPGNHDGVRLMEPQPILDEKYAWPLFNLKNVILTENPAHVNIGTEKNFNGFDILTYHGFSFPFYADTIPSLIEKDSLNNPEKIMAYLLRNRHLAPTHASVQYFPSQEDNLIIRKIPDIFVVGHTHKSAVAYYNNILTISCSCWETKTPHQEKLGNEPDFCKVPMFNLKTRAVKILDFE